MAMLPAIPSIAISVFITIYSSLGLPIQATVGSAVPNPHLINIPNILYQFNYFVFLSVILPEIVASQPDFLVPGNHYHAIYIELGPIWKSKKIRDK